MNYTYGQGELENWIVEETSFNVNHLGKCETIMAQGNGYLGIRAATEESYLGEIRNTFVAGTFNRFAENEVTELPNCADLIQMNIVFDGEKLDLTKGEIAHYSRRLNLKSGELIREFQWTTPRGNVLMFAFKRSISLDNNHVIAQRVEINLLKGQGILTIQSGINGQMTNSGVTHFLDGDKRLYDKKYMQYIESTTESDITFAYNCAHQFTKNKNEIIPDSIILMDRRKIFCEYTLHLVQDDSFTLEKVSSIHTSRDRDIEKMCTKLTKNETQEKLKDVSLSSIKEIAIQRYDDIVKKSAQRWMKEVWQVADIRIESSYAFDQLAIRFAQYHIRIMTPVHDRRMSIGAKGLTGEGYKGHTFWDTEIFILPYYIYTHPRVARQLLEYRYLSLEGAHAKALENGYEGAMFPWESAWIGDGEVTPVWGAADIVTGEPTKIWSGFIEQHITCDIAYASWQYAKVSGDHEFMQLYGYELILDTAKFWRSRLEWNEESQHYHINEVVGPDEYKEHVNNNAFTNYMAHWNIQLAIKYYQTLQDNEPHLFEHLKEKLDLEREYSLWTACLSKIYLPQPNEGGIVPQDDSYLQKTIIDLTPFKNQHHVGSLFKQYNLEQVNNIQVSKQADIMMLFYLMENLFSEDVKRANWFYYEPKTLHDSSLSLSTHSIIANDLSDSSLAYKLFREATYIDLGPNMKTSDHGIHGASLGGIWQCVVNGFAGVRMVAGKLRINPNLPPEIKEISFPIYWQGHRIEITASKTHLVLTVVEPNQHSFEVEVRGEKYRFANTLDIVLSVVLQ